MSDQMLLLFALLVPLAAAALIPLARRQPNVRETVTLAAAGLLLVVVAALVVRVQAGGRPASGALELGLGLELALSVEPLGMLFATVASSLWIVNSIYSIGYMRGNDEPRQTSFYVCFAVALAATMTVAFAANLFTLFVGYEALTLSTYPLVTHKGTDEAKRAGRVYLLMLVGSSTVMLLPAILWTWFLAGTVTFTPGGVLAGAAPLTIGLLLALYIFGIGKAAVIPMHFWLPRAMVAPTPVSALLHAVAVVKAGVFTVLKVVVYIFGIDTLAGSGMNAWLIYVAGFTVLAASVTALRQDNLKRMLAYSTVSQLSYVVLAAAVLAPISTIGAAAHVAAHAVAKITLFFAAGSVYTVAHITEISQMRGIGRVMPWTMGAFAVGALSLIGVPPTVGFVSKWLILKGMMDGGNWVAVAVIVLSTVLNAAYFLPIVVSAFFQVPAAPLSAKASAAELPKGEAPWPIVLALSATAAATVLLFFFPDALVALAESMLER